MGVIWCWVWVQWRQVRAAVQKGHQVRQDQELLRPGQGVLESRPGAGGV